MQQHELGGSGSSGSLPTVTVAYAAPIDLQATKIALDQGFFKAQGLNVKLMTVTSGEQETATIVNGELDFGDVGMANLFQLVEAGVKVKVLPIGDIAPVTASAATAAVITSPTSGITSLRQLQGKTIAEVGVGGTAELGTKEMLYASGVDVSKTSFDNIPYPQQLAALQQGHVQAAISTMPYLQEALAAGMKVLGYPQAYMPGRLWQFYFTTAKFAAANPGLVKKFLAAIRNAATYANAHPDVAQRDAAVAAQAPLQLTSRVPTFVGDWSSSDIDQWIPIYKRFASVTVPIPSGADLMFQG